MLLSRITATLPTTPTTEDIFASATALLFTDDTQVSHGTPGHQVTYHSPRFGQIILDIPVHPDVEEGRQLFAHYLWNSGVIAAHAIESGSLGGDKVIDEVEDKSLRLGGGDEGGCAEWDWRYWNVSGEDVLELGAGTGLPSLIAALSHAKNVTITDHPSSPSLTNDTIQRNVARNLRSSLHTGHDSEAAAADTHAARTSETAPAIADSQPATTNIASPAADPNAPMTAAPSLLNTRTTTHITIAGHTWGTKTFTSPTHYGRLASPQPQPLSFSRILTTDCLWMPSQHGNLIRTILRYLKDSNESESMGGRDDPRDIGREADRQGESERHRQATSCALVVAGFHTGRSTVATFFELATGSAWGGKDLEPKTDTTSTDTKNLTNTQADHPQRQNPASNSEQVQANDPADEEGDDEDNDARGKLHAVSIFEIDVDCRRRSWVPERQGVNKHDAKRWCVCAVLVRV